MEEYRKQQRVKSLNDLTDLKQYTIQYQPRQHQLMNHENSSNLTPGFLDDAAMDLENLLDLAFYNELQVPTREQMYDSNPSPVSEPVYHFDDFDQMVKSLFADDKNGKEKNVRKRRQSNNSAGDRDMRRKHSSNSQASNSSNTSIESSYTVSTTSTMSTDASNNLSDDDKARAKWGPDESQLMWEGILNFGNEWRAIRKLFPDRSYDQVKDKGRRMLRQQRWKTGRTKGVVDDAGEIAKHIASAVLKKPVPESNHNRRPNSN